MWGILCLCMCARLVVLFPCFAYNGVFGKRIYHAKKEPALLSATILAGNGIYHTSNDL